MHTLVTGANRGIGLELTRQLLERGEHVFAACRQPDAASELQTFKDRHGDRLIVVQIDVGDPASIAASYQAVTQHTSALDILINNAAISGGPDPLGKLTQQTLLANYQVNAVGPVLMVQQVLDLLKAGTAKKIVNISTGISSISTRTNGGMYSYTSSKTALNMINKNLSIDLAKFGITAIVIDPGWVKTDMGGPHAWITPEESVTGMLRVFDGLTLEDSGKFFHHSGSEIAW